MAAARKRRPDVKLDKRPHDEIESDGDKPGGSGSRARRNENEILEIVGSRLVARDEVLNTTRPLSSEELRNEVEVRRCADRLCTRERRESGNGDIGKASVMVPGYLPPSLPTENGAEPTVTQELVPRGRAPLARTSVSAQLPAATLE